MARKKEWREGEMILAFDLQKADVLQMPLLSEWINADTPQFDAVEEAVFNKTFLKGTKKLTFWSEENLKMQFISPILELAHILDNDKFVSFFDKSLSGEYEGIKLSVKADFVIGSGLLDFMQAPYFHFQEYKPHRNPTGDPIAQLLEACLIAQGLHKSAIPLYACEVNGAFWRFMLMEGKTYSISKSFDAADRSELLQIIGILRKFKQILETQLLSQS